MTTDEYIHIEIFDGLVSNLGNNSQFKPNGVALTYEQLEAIKREYFYAGRKSSGYNANDDYNAYRQSKEKK